MRWKPVRTFNIHGRQFSDPHTPVIIARRYRGRLVDEILSMPKKEPMSFQRATELAHDYSDKAAHEGRFGNNKGECHWYFSFFVEFISELGFHIELTGDEFMSPSRSIN